MDKNAGNYLDNIEFETEVYPGGILGSAEQLR